MSAFLTEAHGQVVNFPVSPGIGDALTEGLPGHRLDIAGPSVSAASSAGAS